MDVAAQDMDACPSWSLKPFLTGMTFALSSAVLAR